MKLIDVDNFLKRYSNQIPGDTIDAIDLRLALLKEPEVEAIPIDYIKEQIEMCDVLSDICDGRWGDIYQTFSQLLRGLIAPWRNDMGDKGERK